MNACHGRFDSISPSIRLPRIFRRKDGSRYLPPQQSQSQQEQHHHVLSFSSLSSSSLDSSCQLRASYGNIFLNDTFTTTTTNSSSSSNMIVHHRAASCIGNSGPEKQARLSTTVVVAVVAVVAGRSCIVPFLVLVFTVFSLDSALVVRLVVHCVSHPRPICPPSTVTHHHHRYVVCRGYIPPGR